MEKWRSGFIGFFALTMLMINTPAGAENSAQGNDLSTALQAAVRLNPSVKSKIAELKSLGYKLDEAEAGRLPSLVYLRNLLTIMMIITVWREGRCRFILLVRSVAVLRLLSKASM